MTGVSAKAYVHTIRGHTFDVCDYADSTTTFMTAPDLERGSILNELPEGFDGYIFDVGANVGMYSMLASRLYPNAKIIAMEPVPDTYALLVENLKRNKITNVSTVCAGLSSMVETFPIGINTLNSGGASIMHSGLAPVTVQCKALDLETLLVKVLKISDPAFRIGLLKIDVEGMEYRILDCLPEEMWAKVDRLSVELHGFHLLTDLYNFALYREALSFLKHGVKVHFPNMFIEAVPPGNFKDPAYGLVTEQDTSVRM